jgi:MFS family permease
MFFQSLLHLNDFTPRIRGLLWGQLLMNASHFMTVPLLAIYLANNLRLGPAELGTVMGANLVFAHAMPLAAGPFADRHGAKLSMVLGLALRGFGMAGLAFYENFYLLVVAACLNGSGVAIYEAALFGAFGREARDIQPKVFAANNQMLNLGVVIGPMLSAPLSQVSTTLCFALGSLSFFAIAINTYLKPERKWEKTSHLHLLHGLSKAIKNNDFRFFVLASMPWYFLFPQLYVAFPLYLSKLDGNHSSATIYIINGVVGVCYMVLARKWLTNTRPVTLLVIAYMVSTALFGSMVQTPTVLWFFVFVAGYTIAETTIQPAIEVLTSTLSDDESQSSYFGVLSVAGAIAGALGYYAGSWLVLRANSTQLWLVLALVGFLGLTLSIVFKIRMRNRFISLKDMP